MSPWWNDLDKKIERVTGKSTPEPVVEVDESESRTIRDKIGDLWFDKEGSAYVDIGDGQKVKVESPIEIPEKHYLETIPIIKHVDMGVEKDSPTKPQNFSGSFNKAGFSIGNEKTTGTPVPKTTTPKVLYQKKPTNRYIATPIGQFDPYWIYYVDPVKAYLGEFDHIKFGHCYGFIPTDIVGYDQPYNTFLMPVWRVSGWGEGHIRCEVITNKPVGYPSDEQKRYFNEYRDAAIVKLHTINPVDTGKYPYPVEIKPKSYW